MTEQLPPAAAVPKVYAAICAVARAMSKEGISKDRKNPQHGYMFRGIDSVFAALAPHLALVGLVILPRVVERSVMEKDTRAGGSVFYTVLRVEFDFVAVEDGSKHTVCMVGEAMDAGDKSSNKAMSAAYKYACFQSFCIPTEGDNDADAHSHELKAPAAPPPREEKPIGRPVVPLPVGWDKWSPEERGLNRATAGVVELKNWWDGLSLAEKKALKPQLDDWKAIAAKVPNKAL